MHYSPFSSSRLIRLHSPPHVVHDPFMRYRHSLRPPRRSRSVVNVGQIVFSHSTPYPTGGLPSNRRSLLLSIHTHHHPPASSSSSFSSSCLDSCFASFP